MENSQNDESASFSVLDLLKQYADKMDQRQVLWKEGTRACRQQQKAQVEEIRTLKESLLKSQSKSSAVETVQSTVTNDSTNYKVKWEEAELACRSWEKKFIELETGTIKQLQEKVDQLTQEYSRMKSIKERIFEICSCRHLTETQLHDLKRLVDNGSQSPSPAVIATKNDFHQQTIKMRNMLTMHNNDLLTKIEEILEKKRKRNESDEETNDDDDVRL